MANVLGELFQNIADAIRSKTGSTDTLKPNQFPEAIEGITAGGGGSSGDNRVKYVTFMYGETELIKYPVISGDTCRDPVANGFIPTPTKESTAQYNYTFYGWGASDGGAADANILKNITEDKTVYAIFTATARLYTITWLDEDGTELPGQKQWAYGTIPSYTPTKEGVAFDKWTPTPTAVTGDASYTASWKTALASGTFTTGLAWALMADGTLFISGTGATPDYDFSTYTNSPIYKHRTNIKKVVFESGVTTVGNYLFYKYSTIESVTFADTVHTIGECAFCQCTAMSGLLDIPASVVGESAFYECEKVTSVRFGYCRDASFGESAFMYLDEVKSIIIGDKQTSIDSSGLSYLKKSNSLENVSVSADNINFCSVNGVLYDKSVSTLLVYPEKKAGSYDVPDTVTSIPKDVIIGVAGLTAFNVGANNPAYSNPDGIALFNKDATVLVFCPKTVTSYAIPSTVTAIGEHAFLTNANITDIVIPSSVTSIGDYAFNYCKGLKSATIGNGVTSIGRRAFYQYNQVLLKVTFENPNGWYVTATKGATSGTDISNAHLSNTNTAANFLCGSYVNYYWYRN